MRSYVAARLGETLTFSPALRTETNIRRRPRHSTSLAQDPGGPSIIPRTSSYPTPGLLLHQISNPFQQGESQMINAFHVGDKLIQRGDSSSNVPSSFKVQSLSLSALSYASHSMPRTSFSPHSSHPSNDALNNRWLLRKKLPRPTVTEED
jgi:hypothetical protein